ARCQGVVRLYEPLRQPQSRTSFVRPGPGSGYHKRRLAIGEHRRDTRPNQMARILIVAPLVDVSGRRVTAIPERTNVWLRNFLGLEYQYLSFGFFCSLPVVGISLFQ